DSTGGDQRVWTHRPQLLQGTEGDGPRHRHRGGERPGPAGHQRASPEVRLDPPAPEGGGLLHRRLDHR
ncbi:MAG: NAD-dependent glyceraldehyde-3-phosphate dehydrogenase, partial [uncultured Acidimicrobiales bacterium]